MTVQGGGGGGRKIPPGAGTAGSPIPAPRAADASKKPTSSPPSPAPSRPGDGFEAGRADPLRGIDRPLAADVTTPSGIDSMLRVLEDTRTQILDEHRTLRGKIAGLVGELAAKGFDRAVLEERGAELTALRTRMAALRRRLQQIQRRLRAAATRGRGDAHVGAQLLPHLERLRTLEPGLQRALVALQMMEIAFVEPWSGQAVTVVDDDAARAGDDLARALPGATIAAGVARLLGEGSAALGNTPPTASTTSSADADSDTGRLAAVRDALKDSL